MLTAFARFGERTATIAPISGTGGDKKRKLGSKRRGRSPRSAHSHLTICMLQAPLAADSLLARGHLADQLEHPPAVVLFV